jgi:hypothetical protein
MTIHVTSKLHAENKYTPRDTETHIIFCYLIIW